MIKKFNSIIIVVLIQLLSSKLAESNQGKQGKDRCALYKNSKFEWWGTDCGHFCHQGGKKVSCMWNQFHQGCFCEEGFYRNRNWDCVPLEGCEAEGGGGGGKGGPKVKPIVEISNECPPNEEFKKCGNRCMNLCESMNNPKACKRPEGKKACDEGCYCKQGMLRNYNGNCIKRETCSMKMVSGSYKYSFSMSVSVSLWTKKSYVIKHKCPRKGGCKDKLTSKQKCEQGEDYTTCGDKCAESCRNLFMIDNCPLSCEPGCFCKQNFYRTNQGKCVPAPKCPDYNKRKYLTSTTTRKPKIESTTTRPPDKPKPTYTPTSTTTQKSVRNVSDSECPVAEKWTKCGSHCKELCENSHNEQAKAKCPPNMNCMEGCFCKDGLYRDRIDACVPQKECPPPPTTPKPPIKCKSHEQYSKCGSKCSESCNVFNDTAKACAPKCDEGCFCMQGFYRDSFGVCVPQDQCECEIPPQKCRDPKEEYDVCGKNCRMTCDDKKPECKETCARGCFCEQGFVYNENGVCTRPKQCGMDIRNGTKEGNRKIVKPGPKCDGDNEVWSKCGNQCEDFCEPKFDVGNCPYTCEIGCFCKKGYKRNAADQCVLIAKCGEQPVCDENEEYSDCGKNCGTLCKDIGKNRQCSLSCDKGCFCKNGFYRDDTGKCIPHDNCVIDTTPDCRKNEVYKNCSTHCGETCEDLRAPVTCPKPEQECDADCFCDTDLYRDLDGSCGTKLDCNLPPPSENETFCKDNEVHNDCGNRCDESCEDSIKCKSTCENGCFCIQDYLRNKKGVCVPSEKCKGPPQCTECKQNEYYTDCGTDCGRMCTDIGKDKVKCKETACHPGCLCKWGFFRTPDGDCVTKNECQFFIDEDNQGVDYVTTDDPDGIQSPGMRHKKFAADGDGNATESETSTEKVMTRSKKRTKNFGMSGDSGQDYYDHEYDEYSSDFGTLDGSRREQEHYRKHGRRLKPSRQRSGGQEPVPNAEIIGANGRPSRITPKDYRNFGYENYD